MNRLRRLLRRIENFIFARRAYKFVIRDWTALADLESLAAALRSTRFSQTVSPVVMDRPTGERILVIAPHPDDEIIGPGGTLVRAIRAGATVHVVYLTNATGQEGLDREADATAVANSLGYSIQFLGYEADALPATEETAGVLAAAINRFRPDNVFVSFLPTIMSTTARPANCSSSRPAPAYCQGPSKSGPIKCTPWCRPTF